MQPDAARFREILLLQLQLGRQVEQSHLAFLFRQHFVEKREVVAEEQDAAGVVDRLVLAQVVLVEDRRHGRDVLVAEAQIGTGEPGVARLDGFDADLAFAVQHVAGEDFLRDGHRARGLVCDGRQKNLSSACAPR